MRRITKKLIKRLKSLKSMLFAKLRGIVCQS